MLWAGLPYYEDLELEIPVDYVEDYNLEERLTAGRQQMLQNKKVPQDFSTLSGNNGEEKELKLTYSYLHNVFKRGILCNTSVTPDLHYGCTSKVCAYPLHVDIF